LYNQAYTQKQKEETMNRECTFKPQTNQKEMASGDQAKIDAFLSRVE